MVSAISEYLFALVQVGFALWSFSAMIYVWYRVWYVERMWQEPDSEKSEKAVSVSGEIFDVSRALMIGTSALVFAYGLFFTVGFIINL